MCVPHYFAPLSALLLSNHFTITAFRPPVDRPPSTLAYVHLPRFYVHLREATCLYVNACVELNFTCVYAVIALRPT
ncbi:hypothetical protein K438DRAFT_1989934 [Mycena galopus ATCC 62051]|nr:hypothetical protein K438DRAFT_1989934 [Mycena galopus ATCC 62051]